MSECTIKSARRSQGVAGSEEARVKAGKGRVCASNRTGISLIAWIRLRPSGLLRKHEDVVRKTKQESEI